MSAKALLPEEAGKVNTLLYASQTISINYRSLTSYEYAHPYRAIEVRALEPGVLVRPGRILIPLGDETVEIILTQHLRRWEKGKGEGIADSTTRVAG